MLQLRHKHPERGAAMLAALCFAVVLGIVVASYISVCYRSLQFSTRTLQRDQSMQLAELGLEEALWGLNKNDWSTWTINSGTKTATKVLTGFSYENGASGQVNLTIANYDGSTGTRTLTVQGVTTLPDGTSQTRTVRSTASYSRLFANALTAANLATFSSGGSVDSYDSSLGVYNPTTNRSATGAVAGNTVTLTSAQIYGYAAANAALPTYSTSGSGFVKPLPPGSIVSPSPTNANVDLARLSTSAYIPQFAINFPSGAGTTIAGGAISTDIIPPLGNPGDTSPQLYYCNTDLLLTGTATLRINGPVRLVVYGRFFVGYPSSPSASVVIASTGSLELFVTGDLAIYGGGMDNQTRLPKKLAIYDSTTRTAPDIVTTTPFYGVVYLPNGTFTVGSGVKFYGAIGANNVTVATSTTTEIHYDVDLRRTTFAGIDTPFAVAQWQEL